MTHTEATSANSEFGVKPSFGMKVGEVSLKLTGPNLLALRFQRKRFRIKQFGRLFSV